MSKNKLIGVQMVESGTSGPEQDFISSLGEGHFQRVWRQKFARSIPKLGKESTRTATQFLTGHCELN